VRAVFAKAFHRIHRRNLINNGIVPLLLDDALHSKAAIGQEWTLPRLREELGGGSPTVTLQVEGGEYPVAATFTEHERAQLLAGGLLRYLKSKT